MTRRTMAAAAALLLAAASPDSSHDVPYGPSPLQTLDICKADGAGPTPAVVMFHGGGWSGGDKSRFSAACEAFARAGITAISADYRLAAGTPDTAWPVQGQDAEAAFAWTAAHARDLGIDPARICTFGASSGGQLALLAGERRAIAALHPGARRAACVISLSGPTDVAALSAMRRAMVRNLVVNGPPGAASPIAYTGAGDAPALLIHGLADPVIPPGQSIAYAEAASRKGNAVWLITYPGGHVLQGATQAQKQQVQKAEIAFIRSGRLAGPPGRQDLR